MLLSSKSRLTLSVVAATGVVAAVFFFWPSERRQVERAFAKLLSLCEKSAGEPALESLARIRGFLEFWAPGFVASAQPYEGTLTDPQELARVVASYRASADRIRIATSDRSLVLHAPSGTAVLEAVITVDGLRGGSWGRERFRVRLGWRKIEGRWKIEEARVLEVLDSTGVFF